MTGGMVIASDGGCGVDLYITIVNADIGDDSSSSG